MIPKIIHYCWFGRNPLPSLAVKCINSWKKYLPEYEIKEWNESNFDVEKYRFAKEALDCKKYAFVSDVCRLYVIEKFGGIYMDTDVEVLKPLDCFLHHTAFSGFENDSFVPTGIMASVKGGVWANEMLAYYDNRSFFREDGEMDTISNAFIMFVIGLSLDLIGFNGNSKIQTLNTQNWLGWLLIIGVVVASFGAILVYRKYSYTRKDFMLE